MTLNKEQARRFVIQIDTLTTLGYAVTFALVDGPRGEDWPVVQCIIRHPDGRETAMTEQNHLASLHLAMMAAKDDAA